MGDAEINMKYMWMIVKRSNKYVIEFSGGMRKYKPISLKHRCNIPKPHNSKSSPAMYKNNNRLQLSGVYYRNAKHNI